MTLSAEMKMTQIKMNAYTLHLRIQMSKSKRFSTEIKRKKATHSLAEWRLKSALLTLYYDWHRQSDTVNQIDSDQRKINKSLGRTRRGKNKVKKVNKATKLRFKSI